MMIEVIGGSYRGISTPLSEIYQRIEAAGWESIKVQFKSGEYSASAKNQHGEKAEMSGPDPQTAAGKLLAAITRHNSIRTPPPRHSAWQMTWEHQLEDIAQAYLKAPDFESKAGAAWKDLGDDSLRRADMVGRYIEVEVVHDPDPYPTLDDLTEDVRKKRKLKVTDQMLDHPVWSGDQVLAFRIAFDVLGHVASNGDFTWGGQNLAVAAYMPNLSEVAQGALFGEVIARAAYTTFYRGFAPHKIALFDEFLQDRQQQEQASGHRGVHPSQTIPPGEPPTVQSKLSDTQSKFFTTSEQHQHSLESYLTHGVPQKSGERIPLDEHHRLEAERLHGRLSADSEYLYHGTHLDNMAPIARDGLLPHNHPDNLEGSRWDLSEPDKVYLGQQHVAQDFSAGSTLPAFGQVSNGLVRANRSGLDPERLEPDLYSDGSVAHEGPIAPSSLEFYHPESDSWLNAPEAIATFDPPDEGQAFSNLKKLTQAEPELADPNRDWPSGYQPLTNEQNVYQYGGDPLDKQGTNDVAQQLHSGWQDHRDENGEMSHDLVKHAVVQAFRAALLSPNKGLDDNAVQYHAIKHIPMQMGDPQPMADALETDKSNWNNQVAAIKEQQQQQLQMQVPQAPQQAPVQPAPIEAESPVPEQAFAKVSSLKDEDMQKWLQYVKFHRPDLPDDKIHDYAKRRLRTMRIDEEYRILDKDPEMHASDVRDKSTKALEKRLKAVLKPSKAKDGVDVKMGKGPAPEAYGHRYAGWIDGSLDSIAEIEMNADQLAEAAKEDMDEHEGGGWHFRKEALSLNIKGVAPKTVSFAWLLLAPLTSQVAALDTHMAKWLGADEMPSKPRDYFKFERQLKAARDQMGYEDMPLGQFQWALWDLKRNGPGVHQDHSMLRPLNPTDPESITWHPELSMPKGMADQWYDQMAPQWWKQTEDARNAVGDSWDKYVKPNFPEDSKKITPKWPDGGWPWLPRTQQPQAQQDPNYYINPDVTLPIESRLAASGDELHMGIEVPPDTRNQIANWATQLQWPENSELQDPSTYHMTMMYAPQGYGKHHDLGESEPDRNPTVRPGDKMQLFPSPESNYNYAVVLPVHSPELDKWRDDMTERAAERGLNPVQYPGGFKNHITVGYADEAPEGVVNTSGIDPFQAGGLSVSPPRQTAQASTKLAARGIAHWWDLRKPLNITDASWLASMVATGPGRATRKEAIDFIDKHQADIEGSVSDFKEEFLDTYDDNRSFRGSSRMTALREKGLSVEEVWASYA